MFSVLKKLISITGIDAAVGYTILSRIIQAAGGVISIIFISRYLTASEQGYYYTFGSILAIQIFFELGLSGIITQYTAHEFAHLKLEKQIGLIGEPYYKSRLSSLLRFCVKWFGIMAIILFVAILIVGYYFFSKYNNGQKIKWQSPWIILCLSTAANLFIDPLLAFFDGLGEVEDMAKVRLIQRVSYILILYMLFLCGFKLYSSAIASLLAIGINYFQIIFSDRIKIFKIIWYGKDEWVINYVQEIFPYQWRIALSWISGYFIFQLFNPILFATDGAVVAGQMGMTLAALNGILSISISWISTKVPLFSNLIAKKEYAILDNLFNKIVVQANTISITVLTAFVIFVQVLRYNNLSVGNRFLPIIPLCLLALSTFLNQYVFSVATYLRCHKKEPFLIQSIAMGILIASSTIIFGKLYGVNGITIGYSFLTLFLGFPWSIWIFISKRKQWH